MTPSEAMRPAFLSAPERPFLRSHSTAAAASPPVSISAFFASIMPAPVWSRSAFAALASTLNCTPGGLQAQMQGWWCCLSLPVVRQWLLKQVLLTHRDLLDLLHDNS